MADRVLTFTIPEVLAQEADLWASEMGIDPTALYQEAVCSYLWGVRNGRLKDVDES
jgi:hypothetical protein